MRGAAAPEGAAGALLVAGAAAGARVARVACGCAFTGAAVVTFADCPGMAGFAGSDANTVLPTMTIASTPHAEDMTEGMSVQCAAGFVEAGSVDAGGVETGGIVDGFAAAVAAFPPAVGVVSAAGDVAAAGAAAADVPRAGVTDVGAGFMPGGGFALPAPAVGGVAIGACPVLLADGIGRVPLLAGRVAGTA